MCKCSSCVRALTKVRAKLRHLGLSKVALYLLSSLKTDLLLLHYYRICMLCMLLGFWVKATDLGSAFSGVLSLKSETNFGESWLGIVVVFVTHF